MLNVGKLKLNLGGKIMKFKAVLALFLDLLAIGVIGYIAMQTMNLILWTLLMLMILCISYDAFRAVMFLKELIRKD